MAAKQPKPDTAAQNIAPGQGNTIPVKDGEATKKCQKPAECVVWNLSKKTKNDVASTATKKYAENSHGSTKHSFRTGNTIPVKDGEATKKRRKTP